MATLYKCTYFAKNLDGDELFSRSELFSDRQMAIDWLRETTDNFDITLSMYDYPDRVNLYTHILRYEDMGGRYRKVASAIYSYSESGEYNGESCRTTACNENKPVFKTI